MSKGSIQALADTANNAGGLGIGVITSKTTEIQIAKEEQQARGNQPLTHTQEIPPNLVEQIKNELDRNRVSYEDATEFEELKDSANEQLKQTIGVAVEEKEPLGSEEKAQSEEQKEQIDTKDENLR